MRDYRDLQVWFNLSWCGQPLRKNHEIAALFRKGKSFTEGDKKGLIAIQHAFAGETVSFYGRLMEDRGLEISTSPYYHPILPLLCDNRSAREALPNVPLPSSPFSFPEDAREQIRSAQQRYRELFGREVRGMWPSEGSISDPAAIYTVSFTVANTTILAALATSSSRGPVAWMAVASQTWLLRAHISARPYEMAATA